jgi:hypothetical protein
LRSSLGGSDECAQLLEGYAGATFDHGGGLDFGQGSGFMRMAQA